MSRTGISVIFAAMQQRGFTNISELVTLSMSVPNTTETMMPYSNASKIAAKNFVSELRAKTKCERCEGGPIEWHSDSHLTNGNRRVAHLVALGYPIDEIKKEISECNALCRSCHMATDGRLEKLSENKPRQKGMVCVAIKSCSQCGKKEKYLRRGLCNRCNHQQRYKPRFKD